MIIMDIGFNLADGGITYGIIDMTICAITMIGEMD